MRQGLIRGDNVKNFGDCGAEIVPPLLKWSRPVENFIGSTAFVPPTVGLILASEVVKDLLSK